MLLPAIAGIISRNAGTPLFLAEFNGTYTDLNIDNYVPDIAEGSGSHSGIPFQMNNGYFRIAALSAVEQGHIWPHQALPDNFDVVARLQTFVNSASGGQYLQFRSDNSNADNCILFGLGNNNAFFWTTGTGATSDHKAFTFTDSTWYTIKLEVRNAVNYTLFVDREDGNGFLEQGSLLNFTEHADSAHYNLGIRTWYTKGGVIDMPIYDYIKINAV